MFTISPDVDHNSTEGANEAVRSPTILKNNEETEATAVSGDQRVWVKPPDALFTDQIKEEDPECEYQTIVDVKEEIEEVEEGEMKEDEMIENNLKEEERKRSCQIVKKPTFEIQLSKLALLNRPKPSKMNASSKQVKTPKIRMGRRCRPRPILPTRPILPMTDRPTTSTSLEQPSTQHQILMPSPSVPGIAYQIFLGDRLKNTNSPVQYAMLQSQPMFLQQTPSSVATPSSVVMSSPNMVMSQPPVVMSQPSVVMSQPSIVVSQPFPMTRSKTQKPSSNKLIAPKIVGQSHCLFCFKLFSNLNEHVKECWANPESKNYKYRKIAPSTPL